MLTEEQDQAFLKAKECLESVIIKLQAEMREEQIKMQNQKDTDEFEATLISWKRSPFSLLDVVFCGVGILTIVGSLFY